MSENETIDMSVKIVPAQQLDNRAEITVRFHKDLPRFFIDLLVLFNNSDPLIEGLEKYTDGDHSVVSFFTSSRNIRYPSMKEIKSETEAVRSLLPKEAHLDVVGLDSGYLATIEVRHEHVNMLIGKLIEGLESSDNPLSAFDIDSATQEDRELFCSIKNSITTFKNTNNTNSNPTQENTMNMSNDNDNNNNNENTNTNLETVADAETVAAETTETVALAEAPKASKPSIFTRAGRGLKGAAKATGRGIVTGAKATGRGIERGATAVSDHTPGPVKATALLVGKTAVITATVIGTAAGLGKLVGDNDK